MATIGFHGVFINRGNTFLDFLMFVLALADVVFALTTAVSIFRKRKTLMECFIEMYEIDELMKKVDASFFYPAFWSINALFYVAYIFTIVFMIKFDQSSIYYAISYTIVYYGGFSLYASPLLFHVELSLLVTFRLVLMTKYVHALRASTTSKKSIRKQVSVLIVLYRKLCRLTKKLDSLFSINLLALITLTTFIIGIFFVAVFGQYRNNFSELTFWVLILSFSLYVYMCILQFVIFQVIKNYVFNLYLTNNC